MLKLEHVRFDPVRTAAWLAQRLGRDSVPFRAVSNPFVYSGLRWHCSRPVLDDAAQTNAAMERSDENTNQCCRCAPRQPPALP